MKILESDSDGGDVSEAKVLVIIVTYNKKEYVDNLLTSLLRIDYKNYDALVVDNASNDGTVEHLTANFPGVKVIRNSENTGGSGGFNTGLNYAFGMDDYSYYWLLDNDVEVSTDALKKLAKVLNENPDVAVAGSQMCQLDNPEVTNEIGAYVDLRNGGLILNRHLTRKRNNSTGIFYVDYVAAASMLVRADIAKKAGLWEDFFIHFDDVDWCLRIKKMGYNVVGVADSVIWHLSAAEKPITWAMYYDVRNMLYLIKSHGSKKDVARFAKRKILQAIHTELKGMSPIAEIILDGLEDFQKGRKEKKIFRLPAHSDEETVKRTHPLKKTLVFQNEWFDLKKFPFQDLNRFPIGEVMLAPYLSDASCYWQRNGSVLVRNYRKFEKVFILLAALLFGYRKYSRSYVDIRYMPYLPSLASHELVVLINEMNWIIQRNRSAVWKNLYSVCSRGLRLYLRLLFS